MLFFKNNKTKIVVLGNCQARPIAKIIEDCCSKIDIIAVGIVHLLNDNEQLFFEKAYEKADYIFAQRVVDNYPCKFVSSNYLKNNWGHKVIVWPNIYYRGYNPELIYLRLKNGRILRGPLGDYHLQTFIDGWKIGLSLKETLSLHRDIDYNIEHYGNIPECSLLELKKRENECDILISDYIETNLMKRRLFFTFNHPKTELLLKITRSFIELSNLRNNTSPKYCKFEPLGQFEPVINPWIANKYNMDNRINNVWRGVEVKNIDKELIQIGNKHDYKDDEIANLYYKIYDLNKDSLL